MKFFRRWMNVGGGNDIELAKALRFYTVWRAQRGWQGVA
jgi:hypothetical protein